MARKRTKAEIRRELIQALTSMDETTFLDIYNTYVQCYDDGNESIRKIEDFNEYFCNYAPREIFRMLDESHDFDPNAPYFYFADGNYLTSLNKLDVNVNPMHRTFKKMVRYIIENNNAFGLTTIRLILESKFCMETQKADFEKTEKFLATLDEKSLITAYNEYQKKAHKVTALIREIDFYFDDDFKYHSPSSIARRLEEARDTFRIHDKYYCWFDMQLHSFTEISASCEPIARSLEEMSYYIACEKDPLDTFKIKDFLDEELNGKNA